MSDQSRRNKQRQAADQILDKLGVEPQLKQEILADPEKGRDALRSRLGSDVGDLSMFQPEGEVSGYMKCSWTCFFGNWFTTKASWSYDC